ncbi:MAG: bifunctional ADP-dependent NAD(P)H-hydrate dehydratase/NAD(P)H-hydrate epimerase [Hydrogenovibrio crunogenus]|uniref:Bifunctional NAD(P)H-hydrate repair enzyme n=1 Tax=Hydrogenovibrio crunogenus (strain DSM 25203 / XCL-2) TaxID=317025 RepID=Q31EL4_HYDCU|nr:bifunctional ADP-dependent NAD(P)H-hydrate dehydratase/NAD(P)H-hydrate epimerase [Hydrogenovibrio crunogenus]
MMQLYTTQSTQAIERFAIDQQSIPGLLLMKRAAYFSYQTLRRCYPDSQNVLVVCGTGNNGGDGLALAQYALIDGCNVSIALLGSQDKIKGDAQTCLQECLALGLSPQPFDSTLLENVDTIVDAVFGTGLNQPVTGEYAEIFERLNETHTPILALDIPSGLQADTGNILGTAIRASHTCTFITHKPGLYTYLGPETAGKIHFSPLFLSQNNYAEQSPIAESHSLKYWLNQLPKTPASSHKGTRGTLLLIGGNHHMMGAIQLASLAALTTGAGLVKIITQPDHLTALTQAQPELMTYTEHEFEQQAATANVIGIGPGLDQDDWAIDRFHDALNHSSPKVLDADALNLLAQSPQQQNHWVLTPHPGEAARLLGTSTETIQSNRIEAIKRLQQKYGGVIVLKGNGTLVYDGKQMELCTAGNAGMAVGGMGDVLTGAITSFIAQGMALYPAACLAVSLHAHSGDTLANQKSQAGVIPSDLALVMSQLLSYASKNS